jgi:hypothetical protein
MAGTEYLLKWEVGMRNLEWRRWNLEVGKRNEKRDRISSDSF